MTTVKDYYKILEVSKTATADEIQKAYRRLAKLYHPDTHSGNKECEPKFKDINEANTVLHLLIELTKAKKRKEYEISLNTSSSVNTTGNASKDNTVNDILNAFDNFKF